MKESVICVEHYTKRYGTTLAVDDISFLPLGPGNRERMIFIFH